MRFAPTTDELANTLNATPAYDVDAVFAGAQKAT